jgi:hypothetical protein
LLFHVPLRNERRCEFLARTNTANLIDTVAARDMSAARGAPR